MAGSLSTFGKFQTLLHETDLTATQFAALCAAYGIKMTDASLSRALKAGDFKLDTDQMLRPLILRIEDLVRCAGLFKVSFADVENVKLLLDLLNDGHEVSVKIELKPNSNTQH